MIDIGNPSGMMMWGPMRRTGGVAAAWAESTQPVGRSVGFGSMPMTARETIGEIGGNPFKKLGKSLKKAAKKFEKKVIRPLAPIALQAGVAYMTGGASLGFGGLFGGGSGGGSGGGQDGGEYGPPPPPSPGDPGGSGTVLSAAQGGNNGMLLAGVALLLLAR